MTERLTVDNTGRIIERWRKPVIPEGLEERGHLLQVGEFFFEIPVYYLREDDLERVRLGYVCLKCLEPHEVPFPERCSNDNFPMRELQPILFEKLYVGEVKLGPQTTLQEEWDRAVEDVKRSRYYPGTQILVPRDVG